MTTALEPRLVTGSEFDAIRCNRCGDCCEQFYLPGTKAQMLAWTDQGWGRYDRSWLADLVELGPAEEPDEEGRIPSLFRCPRFVREADGTGTCSAYEDRPETCHAFPYGHPVHGFPGCVWSDERIKLAEEVAEP